MKLVINITMIVLFAGLLSCNSKNNKEVEIEPVNEVVTEEMQVEVIESPVTVKELSGYFLKNTYQPEDSINLIVINDKVQFDAFLGVAKTMTNKIDLPDFDNNYIVAIVMNSTDTKTELVLKGAKKLGDTVELNLNINIGEKLSYVVTPVVVYFFPKDLQINVIDLLVDDEIVDSQQLN